MSSNALKVIALKVSENYSERVKYFDLTVWSQISWDSSGQYGRDGARSLGTPADSMDTMEPVLLGLQRTVWTRWSQISWDSSGQYGRDGARSLGTPVDSMDAIEPDLLGLQRTVWTRGSQISWDYSGQLGRDLAR
jgi:hypothetical protein